MAELRKRGDEFWSEFEFYLSDLLVRRRPARGAEHEALPARDAGHEVLPAVSAVRARPGSSARRRLPQFVLLHDAACPCPVACCCARQRCICLPVLPNPLQVGLVLDVVLVTLIAPVARPGRPAKGEQQAPAAPQLWVDAGRWRSEEPP